jgi:alpha-1,4-digalacturonate transport system substrate-binding protein
MSKFYRPLAAATLLSALMCGTAMAQATTIQFMMWQNDVEADAMAVLLKQYEAEHPEVKVNLDVVPYDTVVQALPLRLESGQGPDIYRYSAVAELARYALDLSPYIEDDQYWYDNHKVALDTLRSEGDVPTAIKGFFTEVTAIGTLYNASLFEAAEIPVPSPGATYDDWAEAAKQVAEANQLLYPMAVDRSGHRIMPLLMSYGAKFFDEDGKPALNDDGYKAGAAELIKLFEEGAMAKPIWVQQGGTAYADAFNEFANGQLAVWITGNWQIGRLDSEVGDAFDWAFAPPPCGPADCPTMPGAIALSGYKDTREPEAVAALLDWLAQEPQQKAFAEASFRITGHAGLLASNRVEYDLKTQQAKDAFSTFVGITADHLTPLGTKVLGSLYGTLMLNTQLSRLAQVVAGELTLEDALARIDSDIAASPLLTGN